MTDTTPAVVTPPSLPAPRMEINDLAAMARAIATNVKPLAQTLSDFNLTEQQYIDHIMTNTFFQKALEAMVIEWEGVENTEKRLRLRSQAALDDSLHILAARMSSTDENLPAVIDAAKFFANLGGLGRPDTQAPSSGEKFIIKIDLGADTQIHLEKDVTPKGDAGEESIRSGVRSLVPQISSRAESESPDAGTGEKVEENSQRGRASVSQQPHPEKQGGRAETMENPVVPGKKAPVSGETS